MTKHDNNPKPEKGKPERPVYTEGEGRDYLESFLSGPAKEKPAKEAGKAKPNKGKKEGKGDSLKQRVIQALSQIYDPEIPVNIYDLGLIYDIEADDNGKVVITMTLTTPHCPVAETMPGEVEMRVGYVEGVQEAEVNLVWDPPWDPSKMSEAAQLELGFL